MRGPAWITTGSAFDERAFVCGAAACRDRGLGPHGSPSPTRMVRCRRGLTGAGSPPGRGTGARLCAPLSIVTASAKSTIRRPRPSLAGIGNVLAQPTAGHVVVPISFQGIGFAATGATVSRTITATAYKSTLLLRRARNRPIAESRLGTLEPMTPSATRTGSLRRSQPTQRRAG